MSLIFMDSFDDGLMAQKWTSVINNTVISTSNPRTGTHRVQNNTTVANDGGGLVRAFSATEQHATFVVGMGYLQISNAARPEMAFLTLMGPGAATHLTFRREDDGSLSVYRGGGSGAIGGTLIASTAPNLILTGNWYHVEVKAFLDDVVGTVEVRINNTTVVNFVGDTRNGGTSAVFDSLRVFSEFSGDAINAAIDDFYVLNGAGATNNNLIGDSRIHNLLPNGNGFYSELVGSDGNSVDNYLQVDETPPDSVTTYNGGATSGDQDSYAFPDLPVAVTAVRAVAQRAWAASSDAGSRAARNFVRIAGVDYNSADYNVGATYLHFETLFNVSPATAVAFTPAEFNAAEWGFEVRA